MQELKEVTIPLAAAGDGVVPRPSTSLRAGPAQNQA